MARREFHYGPHDTCIPRNDLLLSRQEVYNRYDPYKPRPPPPPPAYLGEMKGNLLIAKPEQKESIAQAYRMTTSQVHSALLESFQKEDIKGKGYVTRSAACRVVQSFGKEHGLDASSLRLLFNFLSKVKPPEPGRNAPPAHSLRYAGLSLELAQEIHSIDECRRHQVTPPTELPYNMMTPEEQEGHILRAFTVADKNVDNELSHTEFVLVVQRLVETLKLSTAVMHRLFAEADFNANGAVEYASFTPIAVKLIARNQRISEKVLSKKIAKAGEELLSVVNAGPLQFDVHDVETMMRRLFESADEHYAGYLTHPQFKMCLFNCGMGLSDAEVNAVMTSAKLDPEGRGVEYRHFVPVAWDLITRAVAHIRYDNEPTIMMKHRFEHRNMETITEVDDEHMEHYLEELFSIADHNKHGALDESEFRKLMAMSGFKFSDDQLKKLLVTSDKNKDGEIDVGELKAMIAGMKSREEAKLLHWLKNDPLWTKDDDDFRSQAADDKEASNILKNTEGIWTCTDAEQTNWIRFDLGAIF